jgi:hypothetical protein
LTTPNYKNLAAFTPNYKNCVVVTHFISYFVISFFSFHLRIVNGAHEQFLPANSFFGAIFRIRQKKKDHKLME